MNILTTKLSGDAEDYYYEKKELAVYEKYTFDQWLVALQARFPEQIEKKIEKYSVKGLMELEPLSDETLPAFIVRFSTYRSQLGKDETMVALARECLINAIKPRFGYLLKSVVIMDGFKNFTCERICEKLVDLSSSLDGIFVEKESETAVYEELLKRQDDQKNAEAIEKLTKELEDMKIAISKRPAAVKDFSRLTCFNCGNSGHQVRDCTEAADYDGRKKRYEEHLARRKAKETNENEKKAMVILSAQHKRVRIDDLIDNEESKEAVPVVKPKDVKKTAVSKITKVSEMLNDKVLDAPITLTIRELVKLRPATLKTLVNSLSDGKHRETVIVVANPDEVILEPINVKGSQNHAESYILVNVGEQEVSLFVDVGASCCIVTEEFLKTLGIAYKKNGKPASLLPADGGNMDILGYASVVLTIGRKVDLCVEFAVVKRCVVPFVLGIDLCQVLESRVDYKTSTWEFDYEGKRVSVPLCTKSEVNRALGAGAQEVHDEHVLFVQMCQAQAGFSRLDDMENLLLSMKKRKKIDPILPPVPSFKIDRQIPNDDCFEEDLKYFDLPGQVGEDFDVLIDEKVAAIDNVTEGTKEKLVDLLKEYRMIFPSNHIGIPGIKGFEFEILIDTKQKPICQKKKAYTNLEKETILEHTNAMLEHGIISPCQSPWGFQPVLAPKSDGSLRFCINFKPLNRITLKDKYPVPLILELLQFINGNACFSVMDCFAGYWQIKLSPESRQYCVVNTPFGSFCFNVLPFGLSNAVSYFQSVMEKIFQEFLWEFMVIYLDDLCVVSKTEEQHLEHLRKVFQLCLKWGVCLKFSKCKFFVQKFRYLGLICTTDGVLPDPEKVEALVKRREPQNVKELRSFVCLGSYFRRFIPNYSEITICLFNLLKKGAYWDWTKECQEAFELVKETLTKTTMLYHVKPEGTLVLSTDCSKCALGAVLEQLVDGQLFPIAFYSRTLLPAEKNYMNYEREGLALVASVKHFRQYLLDREFIVYTDNSAVAAIYREKDPVGRMIRWIHVLNEFNCEIRHRNGKENMVADYFSRPIINLAVVKRDSKELSLLEIFHFLSGKIVEPGFTVDKKFLLIVSKFTLIKKKLYRKTESGNLLVIYDVSGLHVVLDLLHDRMGHFGIKTLWTWIKIRFWRPELFKECENYVKSCIKCQEYSLKRPIYKFNGQSGISGVFDTWYLDFLGPFPESSNGNVYICCAINALTGFPYCESTPDATSISATRMTENLCCLFGVPLAIRCDNGPAFRASSFKELCAKYGVRLELLPAYTPEWAGFVERLNGTIRYSLAKTCDENYEDWCKYLPQILYGIRAKVMVRTGQSPFYLTFGVEAKLPFIDRLTAVGEGSVETRVFEVEPLPGLRASFEREAISSSSKVVFVEGDLVMVLSGSIRKRGIVDKKKRRYEGPFKVIKVMEHGVYSCMNAAGDLYAFHVSRLVLSTPRIIDLSSKGAVKADMLSSF
jgi:hypothetical protein